MTSRTELNELNLSNEIRQALKEIHRENVAGSAWQKLLLFHTTRRSGAFRNDRQVINQILLDAVVRLEQVNALHARILRLRFLDKVTIYRIANELNLGESTIYAQQRAAIENLIEIIDVREKQAHAEIQAQVARRLPLASYHQLVGVEPTLARLLKLVDAHVPPWLISIEGIGGIGKTSLAHALLQRAVERGLFSEIAWVTAKDVRFTTVGELVPTIPSTYTAQGLLRHLASVLMPEVLEGGSPSIVQLQELLRSHLQETAHLIVVDNLETVTDLETLVPLLQKLANPTKFVLTTREGFYSEPNVFPLSIVELGRAHAFQLLRQEATFANLPEVADVDDNALQTIYDTVGGNPLALRLVIGLLHIHDLPTIVHDLREAQGLAVENLYTFIYWRAWEALDEVSRNALLNMLLLPPSGDTIEYLDAISELSMYDLRSAIQKMVMMNLIEVRGAIERRLYAIHGLTRTFLLKQVTKWI